MLHYLSIKKRKGFRDKEECLCWNGSFEENKACNLTRTIERINCPSCLAILKLAKEKDISLEDARTEYINNS
jgi:hypothetical protein